MRGALSSTDRASDFGSEGLGFESLRARFCPDRPALRSGFPRGARARFRRDLGGGMPETLGYLLQPLLDSRSSCIHGPDRQVPLLCSRRGFSVSVWKRC